MKKQTKKLVLAKETLRNLGSNDLVQVAGATVGPGGGNCNPAPSETCPPTGTGGDDTTSNHTIIIIRLSREC
jgi:hypothetical protein